MRQVDDYGTRVTPAAAAEAAELRHQTNHAVAHRRFRHGRRRREGVEDGEGSPAVQNAIIDGHGPRRKQWGLQQSPAEGTPTSRYGLRPSALLFQSWIQSTLVANMSLILLACIVLRPAAAAIVPWENCLLDSYRYNVPTLLQWQPYHAEAWFDTENPSHTLRVTMWGNVAGSLFNVTLPPPNSTDWTDPTKLDGKILDEPEPDSPSPKLTTLYNEVNVLTYEPWAMNYNFCKDSLKNASCPLGPVFNTTNMYVSFVMS